MAEDSSWGGRLLTWFVIAVAAIVALKVAAWLAATLVGVFFFLLFTVVPLAVLGWLIVKLFRVFREDDEYRPA
jgi:positive regulator of sigma E activity